MNEDEHTKIITEINDVLIKNGVSLIEGQIVLVALLANSLRKEDNCLEVWESYNKLIKFALTHGVACDFKHIPPSGHGN